MLARDRQIPARRARAADLAIRSEHDDLAIRSEHD